MVVQWEELAQVLPERNTAVTIGVFDGVHLGHRHLVERIKQQAQVEDCATCVVTFRRHPEEVLRPHVPVPYLVTLEERISLLPHTGGHFPPIPPGRPQRLVDYRDSGSEPPELASQMPA